MEQVIGSGTSKVRSRKLSARTCQSSRLRTLQRDLGLAAPQRELHHLNQADGSGSTSATSGPWVSKCSCRRSVSFGQFGFWRWLLGLSSPKSGRSKIGTDKTSFTTQVSTRRSSTMKMIHYLAMFPACSFCIRTT